MDALPAEILCYIFSFCLSPDLAIFCFVCKYWNEIAEQDACFSLVCNIAAKRGHLDLLQWAKANGCPCDERTYASAIKGNQLEVVKWLYHNGCRQKKHTFGVAVRKGRMNILLWLEEYDFPKNKEKCVKYAISYGNLEVLQWLACNHTIRDDAVEIAARWGQLHILKWLVRTRGRECYIITCVAAARGGHLETLKWLRANGCPWDGRVCTRAAQYGHLELLQWARANGCPWGEKTFYWAIHSSDYRIISILEYLRVNECPFDDLSLRNLDAFVVIWLKEYGYIS